MTHFRNKSFRVGEQLHGLRFLQPITPARLTQILWNHVPEGENWAQLVILWPPHTNCGSYESTHTQEHKHTCVHIDTYTQKHTKTHKDTHTHFNKKESRSQHQATNKQGTPQWLQVRKLRQDVSPVETKTNSLTFQTDIGSKRPSRKAFICWQLFLDLTYTYMEIF